VSYETHKCTARVKMPRFVVLKQVVKPMFLNGYSQFFIPFTVFLLIT